MPHRLPTPFKPLSRRLFSQKALAWGALLWAAVELPSVGKPSRPAELEKPKLTVGVDGKSAFYHLPLTIADRLGYFKAEGLELEVVDFSANALALQALWGGAVDICSGSFEHTLALQVKNQFIQAFVLQGRAPQIAFGVSTKTMPGYKTLDDLRGKKIGVSSLDGSSSMLARLVLARGGLKIDDVVYAAVGSFANAANALRTGYVDAISHTDPMMTMLEQKGEVKIIQDTRSLKSSFDFFGGSMPAACLYAPPQFIQKNPNTCQALANAIVHSLKWLQTAGPGDLIKAVPENYMLGDRALYLASFSKVRECMSLDGIFPEEGPRTALRALSPFDQSFRVSKIDLSKTYTNEFAKRAKELFKV